jgi:membrane protease YdiL (CAAX protease family)
VFVLACTVGILGLRLVHSSIAGWIPVEARPASFMLVMAGGLLIGHAWTFHLVDHRGWSFVGLGREALAPRSILTGAALGALAIALPCLMLLGMGWLQIVPGDTTSTLGTAVAALALLVPAALWEELFVRGYAFSLLRERWGALAAIVVTSVVFGATHLINADVTVQAVLVVALGGVFLGLIRDTFRSLYAAWAAHLAWNVTLVTVLHASVSGLAMEAPRYRIVDAGPDWATGGAWGPEGGWFAAVSLAIAIAYVYRKSHRTEPDA